MMTTLITQGNASIAPTQTIQIRITPTLEREFKRRNIFPELRLENAIRRRGATGIYSISLALAHKLISEAHIQYWSRGLKRGLPFAYKALKRNLTTLLQEKPEQSLLKDPGLKGAQWRQTVASACFNVGDKVVYFDGGEYGHYAIVVEEYQIYCVLSEDGPYLNEDNERIEYRYGYIVELFNTRIFAPAHKLTADDCKPAHIRLVM